MIRLLSARVTDIPLQLRLPFHYGIVTVHQLRHALLQDLAAQAAFGNASVERNGHHYSRGTSMWPAEVRDTLTSHHPDLFTVAHADHPRLDVRHGEIGLESINRAPFGLDPWLGQVFFD